MRILLLLFNTSHKNLFTPTGKMIIETGLQKVGYWFAGDLSWSYDAPPKVAIAKEK